MTEEPVAEIDLEVRGAEKRDAGRGIARLPESARNRLGVLSGDTLLVEGDRVAAAKLWPARPDAEPGTIRIDADTRANAGVRIGDRARVRKATDLADAERVRLTPAPSETPPTDLDADAVARAVRRDLRDRPVRAGEVVRIERAGTAFVIADAEPAGTVTITDDTSLDVDLGRDEEVGTAGSGTEAVGDAGDAEDRAPADAVPSRAAGRAVTYEDIGGLDEELDRVRETVELPLSEPDLFARLGIEPPKGVLLYGPPGTGKTLIARAVANEVDATFVSVSGPEITSKYKGESEERLREVFAEAREAAPSIVFFDELDSIAAERGGDEGMENRIVGQLLSLMDGLEARGDVVVVGATNRVDALDPALRRGGRFDREVEIGAPNEAGRREILDVHTRRTPLGEDVDLDRLAARTHGFVGADLASLVKEAAMTALRRVRHGADTSGKAGDRATDGESGASDGADGDLRVTRADFETAMANVSPSAMREYVAEQPTKGFEAVGGLEEPKVALERAVTWPLRYGPLFEAAAADPPTGVLLYGPPGTGKTLLARAVAAESGVNFVSVDGPELLDRYVGESERAVREMFERARQAAPAIVFLDEVDAVAADRDRIGGDSNVGERVVSQLLTELDRAADNPGLVVLAATNRRGTLDPALLRSGRLESHVEVPAPDETARRAILAVHTRDKPLADGVDLDALAARTGGYSGADLAAVCREAATRAVREVADRYAGEAANEHADEVVVRPEHFEAALDAVAPSLD
ncbi:MAG: AAA family ATPase [Haloferacaceae archaeon]